MPDIYKQIWDADQSENGIQPILDTQPGDRQTGYVKVNSQLDSNNPDLRVLTGIYIPESKKRTYDLCRVLFDNYALSERDEEQETAQEREEVHNLVHAMVDTAPMQVAKDYIASSTGTSITRERWYNTVMEMWFRRFSDGGDPHLTGFEHVVVGEQQGAVTQGYHFWYKYYLDDGFARLQDGNYSDLFPGLSDDRISYLGTRMTNGQQQFPESVTISYKWNAPDYDRGQLRPLTKPTGGFFVGCSIEGLLALGTVRAHLGVNAPTETVINGAKYSLKLYHSPSRYQVRTFYPVFLGAVDTPSQPPGTEPVSPATAIPDSVASPVRIIAALVNPPGADPGKENVTIINTAATPVPITGWKVADKNRRTSPLGQAQLAAGAVFTIELDGRGAQLGNQGGEIRLEDAAGRTAHLVTYSKSQVKAQGVTILF